MAVTSLVLAGCGSKATETDTANAQSCVDTAGSTIKVGALKSLSGTRAISEVTVRNAIELAVEQINGAGGVMGKQIQRVGEDGASEPTVFAEKAEKLISRDCVAAVFGGWTSSSRKAMCRCSKATSAPRWPSDHSATVRVARDTPPKFPQTRTLAESFGKLVGMGAPLEPVVLAEQGDLVVAEHGPVVVVIDRGNGPLQITAFVLAIVTLVFGGFGIVSLTSTAAGAMDSQFVAVGGVLLVIGIAAGVALFLAAKAIRANRRRPLNSFAPVAVFDLANRVYRDGTGQVIAPLDQVRFERRIQLTSSSPKLVAVTPWGTHLLKRGNPFGGGIGSMDQVLDAAVHGS